MAEFDTRAIHSPYIKSDPHGTLQFPVYDCAAFEFESAEDIEKAFNGQKLAHAYSRITNPTVENFEQRIKNITQSLGAAALSSGMAAISNLILTVCESGDNIITTKYLFGNTYSLFEKTLKPWGFQARYADLKNIKDIERLIDGRTRAVFLETITNPQLEIADINLISAVAKHHGLAVIADSTMTPLSFFQPEKLGIDIEAISATKYISGGAVAVGGLIIDHGTYDWRRVPKFSEDAKKFGPMALLIRLKREVHRNIGACLSPHNAYLLSLGLESFNLRVEKSCSNALAVGTYLSGANKITKVNYSGLETSPYHNIAKKQFNDKYGGLLTFNLQDKAECFRFINQLKLIKRATNINDNKSLIIHPASTIFCEYPQELRDDMGVPDNLIRLSVGIENPDDLISDIKQALEAV